MPVHNFEVCFSITSRLLLQCVLFKKQSVLCQEGGSLLCHFISMSAGLRDSVCLATASAGIIFDEGCLCYYKLEGKQLFCSIWG